MAANLPAVCIDDEAFQGTIVDQLNGFIFKDEKEYCDLILKLNKSVKEREKIGNQGKNTSPTFIIFTICRKCTCCL